MGYKKGKQAIWSLVGPLAIALTNCTALEREEPERSGIGQSQQALELETVLLRLPVQGNLATTFMSTTSDLSIFSQAIAGTAGATPWLANFGTGQTHLQSQGRVNGNIRSVGSVKLDAQSYVAGSIWTKGSIIKQPPLTITGGQFQGPSVNVAATTTSWDIDWGDFAGPDVVIAPAPTETWVDHPPLAPGAYGTLDVHRRNHVSLTTGVYAFQRFNTEPEVQLHLDTSAGPIVVYVRDNYGEESWQNGVGSKGMVLNDSGNPAQLFFVFMGTKDVFVQGSWQGTIVAPKARIKLERPSNPGVPGSPPSHRGAFFGKSIEVASGSHTVRHVPYTGPFPPPPPPIFEPITPVVTCVDSIGDGRMSAKFGYENAADVTVSIPVGEKNQLTPTPLEVLGQTTTFESGTISGAFRAVFAANGSLTWTVRDRSATADATAVRCPLPPPVGGSEPRGEAPRGFSSKVGPLKPYRVEAPDGFFSKNFDDPSGSVPLLSSLIAPAFSQIQSVGTADIVFRVTGIKVGRNSWNDTTGSRVQIATSVDGLPDHDLPQTEVFTCGFGDPPFADCTANDAGGTYYALPESNDTVFVYPVDAAQANHHIDVGIEFQTADLGGPSPIWTVEDFRLEIDLETGEVQPATGAWGGTSGKCYRHDGEYVDGSGTSACPPEDLCVGFPEGQPGPPSECAEQCLLSVLGGARGWELCYTVELDVPSPPPPTPPPAHPDGRLCVHWNTDYVDEGFGEAVVGPYRASYAEYFAAFETPRAAAPIILGLNRDPVTGAILAGTSEAFLDADGCIPSTDLDPGLLVHNPTTEVLSLDLRVRSRLSDGSRTLEVRNDPDNAVSDLVDDAYFDSRPFIVTAFSGVPTAGWESVDAWIRPVAPVLLLNSTLEGTTQVAATASHMLVNAGDLTIIGGDYDVLVGAGCDNTELTIDPPLECSSDQDCTGIDTVCDTAARVCGCRADADCLQGRLCANINATGFGKCGSQGCESDADCTGLDTVCNAATGTCGCQEDGDCRQQGICDVDPGTGFGSCGPPACMDDADCIGISRACDTGTGRCGCRSNANCRDGRSCEGIDSASGFGECTARFCSTDEDCEGVDAICNPNTNTCGCSSDADCRDERTCEARGTPFGRCGCQSDADCMDGRICEIDMTTGFGTCEAVRCTTSADCAGLAGPDRLCNPMTRTCGCTSDASCAGMLTCEQIQSFGRCGTAGLGACFNFITDKLLIGPATLALNSRPCTATGGECAVPGQACTTADSMPCPTGSVCQCRWVDQARWKFVVAHEAGHMFQHRAVGPSAFPEYTFRCDVAGGCAGATDRDGKLFDPPDADPMCGCAHIDSANRLHCLQSVELMQDAESEGFAQFFASRVFNSPANPDECTFVYYKEGLLDDCPDPDLFDCEPRSGKVKVLPPFPVACGVADKWRNTRCGGLPGTNDTTLAEMGTENDWMQFLWSWNTRAPNNATLLEIYRANRQVCHPDTCLDGTGGRIPGCTPSPASAIDADGARTTSCTSPPCAPSKCGFVAAGQFDRVRYTWLPIAPPPPLPPMPTPEEQKRADDFLRARSYRDGVVGYYDAEIKAASAVGDTALEAALRARQDHFLTMAEDHGVNENTMP